MPTHTHIPRSPRDKLMQEGAAEKFLSGERQNMCPRCGSSNIDWQQEEGSLDEGWQENTIKCLDCNTEWVESFECKPIPVNIWITELAEERETDPNCPYRSHRKNLSPEELEKLVDTIITQQKEDAHVS